MPNLKNQLAKKFEEFKKIPFPNDTIDALGNEFVALVDLDSYIAGIVSTFLQGKNVKQWDIKIDEELNKIFFSYVPKNEQERKDLQKFIYYKKRLDELVQLLIDCLNEYNWSKGG